LTVPAGGANVRWFATNYKRDADGMGERSEEQLVLGVVVERRPAAGRWSSFAWRAVEVVPGLAAAAGWRALPGDRFAAGGLTLRLHRAATEDYRYALSAKPPQLYVVLGRGAAEGVEVPFRPALVTASPWEAQACQDSGEDQVDAVPLPPALLAWVEGFVERHHVERPFFKRRRKGLDRGQADNSEFVRVSRDGQP
jgi:hypothetical protein